MVDRIRRIDPNAELLPAVSSRKAKVIGLRDGLPRLVWWLSRHAPSKETQRHPPGRLKTTSGRRGQCDEVHRKRPEGPNVSILQGANPVELLSAPQRCVIEVALPNVSRSCAPLLQSDARVLWGVFTVHCMMNEVLGRGRKMLFEMLQTLN